MSLRGRLGLDPSQFRITRGALMLALGGLGLSLVWLLAPTDVCERMIAWIVASPSTVFDHGRVWTLATTVFLEPDFLGMILHMIVLWTFVPTLERFWGMRRFIQFVAITSLAGTLAATLFGFFVTGHDEAVAGLNPFIFASIVAYGVTYARQQVRFFGVLPLTGRQLMFGFIGFLALSVLLQQDWDRGAMLVASMGTAAVMTSKWSPMLAWKRRKIARARAKLTLLLGGQGGKPASSKPKRDDQRFIN